MVCSSQPPHEKPFLLLVTGLPEEGAFVKDIDRKPLVKISSIIARKQKRREHMLCSRRLFGRLSLEREVQTSPSLEEIVMATF